VQEQLYRHSGASAPMGENLITNPSPPRYGGWT
jgi:hypothetical protein